MMEGKDKSPKGRKGGSVQTAEIIICVSPALGREKHEKIFEAGTPERAWKMKSFLISAVLGFIALALLNLCAPYTGVALPVSRLSIAASGLLGIPGVTLMVLLNAFL